MRAIDEKRLRAAQSATARGHAVTIWLRGRQDSYHVNKIEQDSFTVVLHRTRGLGTVIIDPADIQAVELPLGSLDA